MTERLYLADSHLTTCTARVTGCEPDGGAFLITLERTVLFPNAGGQPCDLGTIDGARVLAVDEKNGEVVHRVERVVPVGTDAAVTLDFARRFDNMQQHTGEHLLSFVLFDRYGASNVGFHLSGTYATIDLDKPLSEEDVQEAVRETNRLIACDLAVKSELYASEAALAGLPLRKHAEGLSAPIRVVSIEDADCCTCCAPHCRRTGEVGSLLLTELAGYKGGVRLTFLCGMRAWAYAAKQHAALDRIARRFSTARENAVQAVEKLDAECAALRRENRTLLSRVCAFTADTLVQSAEPVGAYRLVTGLLDGFDAGGLKQLAPLVVRDGTLCCLFSREGERLHYLLGCGADVSVDMGEACQAVNALTGGRGGGRGTRAQGMAQQARGAEEIEAQARHYLVQRLKALKTRQG